MKFLLIVILALSVANASELGNLLKNNLQASDAVDSALQLLRDLKQSNLDAQAADDALNVTREIELTNIVNDFYNIAENNKQAGDDADAHRDYLSDEISRGIEYGRWIINRRAELHRKRKALSEGRCVANAMFIKSLKMHKEALEVIVLLKDDVAGIVEEHTNPAAALLQLKDSFGKLGAYAELFKAEQIAEFNQLTQNEAQEVDQEYLQGDANAVDNTRGQQVIREADNNTEGRNTAQRFVDMINKLEQHMIDSMRNLEDNEIQAALDLATWISHSEQDLQWLDQEETANKIRQDKLAINIVGATSQAEAAWNRYFESSAAYHSQVESREQVRSAYLAERARRAAEIELLDEVIKMFIEQVSVLDSSMRELATDHNEDGVFDGDIARSVDTIYAKDAGNLHENVVAEQSAQ